MTLLAQSPEPEEEELAPDITGPDDLVVWSHSHDSIEALAKSQLTAVLRAAPADHREQMSLLRATYVEPKVDTGGCKMSLLDLAVRFGQDQLAAELASSGVQALCLPAIVSLPMCEDLPPSALVSAGGIVKAALAAGLASGAAAGTLWRPGPRLSLLDVAVLAGEAEAAGALRVQGLASCRSFAVEDFLRPARPAERPTDALGFHMGLAVNVPVLEAALRGGVSFRDMISIPCSHTSSRHRQQCSILDAAILSGQRKLAAALVEAGAVSALGPRLPGCLFVLDESGYCILDSAAVESALAAGVGLQGMVLPVVAITFSYPMKKLTQPFCLLDVAVCLGQRHVAELLLDVCAEEVAVCTLQSALAETHLSCTEVLFPLSFWVSDTKACFPKKNSLERAIVAVAVAYRLGEARSRAIPQYMILLAQWARLWTRRRGGGGVQLRQPAVLRQVLAFALPRPWLSLPHLEACLGALRPRARTPRPSLCGLASAEAAVAGLRAWFAQAGPGLPP